MNDALKALAERVVKAAGWAWMAGMLAVPANRPTGTVYRITVVDDNDCPCGVEDGAVSYPRTWGLYGMDYLGGMDPCEWLPDLSDDATVGCLLALVRKKHGPQVFVCPAPVRHKCWRVYRDAVPPYAFVDGETEVEALVFALEVE